VFSFANFKTALAYFILVFVCVCLIGCGKNVPLQGKVLYDDGTPITVGMVNFTTDKNLSRGKIQPDGSYAMGTKKEKDGLPPGIYKIYITGAEIPIEPKEKPEVQLDENEQPVAQMPRYQQLVGKEYMTASTTPLTCEVPVNGNSFDIIVKKPNFD
jgi:hypothetical protein